ncbi:DoxX family protein [Flavobacterium sp. DGU38]|uniref:DoxX family protein n=1 Tax=Flavobacterium calami TaxID=3139144 RepID=A0ABU9IQC5_9FLAO
MKTKKIITWTITILAAALVVMSGVMKLLQGDEITAKMQKVSVDQYIIALGLMEILFSALFVFPRTLKIGFILLSCYFAGALAVELSYGSPKTALIPLVLIWVSAFLRDKEIFTAGSDISQKKWPI